MIREREIERDRGISSQFTTTASLPPLPSLSPPPPHEPSGPQALLAASSLSLLTPPRHECAVVPK
jgi:hypothetical protein